MSGINRASKYVNEAKLFSRIQQNINCIFISHQKRDAEICRHIADYIMKADIDVYFDEYDIELQRHHKAGNSQGVTNAIRKGIEKSSHMLCVLSPNTLDSKWVPFEVGYGFDKTDLGVLTLKNIPNDKIPDYIKTAKVIVRGTKSLNKYMARITKRTVNLMESREKITFSSTDNHPLDNYLDWNR